MEVGLAVDPGVTKGNAYALFVDGELVRLEMGRDFTYFLSTLARCDAIFRLAIEIPVIRQTGQQKGRQSDIIDLAIECGRVIEAFKTLPINSNLSPDLELIELSPEEWKGQLPKQVCCDRIYERLTDDEKKLVPKEKKNRNDLLDAVGIGFHVFDRKRAIR